MPTVTLTSGGSEVDVSGDKATLSLGDQPLKSSHNEFSGLIFLILLFVLK